MSFNRFASLTTNDDISDDGIIDTIVGTINSHMANISTKVSVQTAASNDANSSLINASLQQFAANKAQQNQQHLQVISNLQCSAQIKLLPQLATSFLP